MAETAQQVADKLRPLLQAGYRNRLTARGAARAMVWRSGALPEGGPALGQALTQELLSYGFGTLRTALKAKSLGVVDDNVLRGFELSAEALEALVKNGDPDDTSRGFYRTVAAASYHLARYSARAFSLLSQVQNDQNLSKIERALSLLILRQLDELYSYILHEVTTTDVSDETLAARLESTEDDYDLQDALAAAATENYLRALAAFLFALRANDDGALRVAEERLTEGESLCFNCAIVSMWWIYRLTRFLIDDLWKLSIQHLLPLEIGGESNWPRLRSLFVASLLSRGIAELDLWPSQIEITKRLADSTDNIVASLPTSAGKTRIAELCILRALATGHRVVFVTPLRALSAQTERTLRKTFGPLGFEISTLYGSAGASYHDIDSLAHRHIVVSTPEKLDFALRNNPDLLNDVSLLVLDEGHMLGPTEREIRYEVLIQRLLRRPDAKSRRIVCLSAMLPSGAEMDDFVTWLRQEKPGSPITSSWRPTRQRFGRVIWNGSTARYELKIEDETTYIQDFFKLQTSYGPKGGAKRFPNDHNDVVVASAWRLAQDKLSVLIYCPEKRSVNAIAKTILKAHKEGHLKPLASFDPESIKKACAIGNEWLGKDHPALKCLGLGVGLHHAAFPKAYLKEIDSLIASKALRIIVASPTLARGLNISASCVLFQSTERFDMSQRRRTTISFEEFSNVAGRAGRAYVDLDGQVLGICSTPDHVTAWNKLVLQQHKRKLESGLIVLAAQLLGILERKLGKKNITEYILNSSQVWTSPIDHESEDEWNHAVEILDIAILSLLGEEDCTPDNVAAVLDKVLSCSLLRTRLKHYKETDSIIVNGILSSRTKYICETTSLKQRRGYFFSGVGLHTGRFLDLHSSSLNAALLSAEDAIQTRDEERCIEAIISIAERIFEISPFKPNVFPESWKAITRGWLTGSPMHQLQALSDDAAVFIEDALVYKLAWAVEAIRVRSKAEEEELYEDKPTRTSAAIETGTLSLTQALLIQSGLNSRIAAAKALKDYPSNFTTRSGMLTWLTSEDVMVSNSLESWPTPETRLAWLEFVALHGAEGLGRWGDLSIRINVSFYADTVPSNGSLVFLLKSKSGIDVFTADMKNIGHSSTIITKLPFTSGVGHVESTNAIMLHYTGPVDDPSIHFSV